MRGDLAEQSLGAHLALLFLDRDHERLKALVDRDPVAAVRAALSLAVAQAMIQCGDLPAVRQMLEVFAATIEVEQIFTSNEDE